MYMYFAESEVVQHPVALEALPLCPTSFQLAKDKLVVSLASFYICIVCVCVCVCMRSERERGSDSISPCQAAEGLSGAPGGVEVLGEG